MINASITNDSDTDNDKIKKMRYIVILIKS